MQAVALPRERPEGGGETPHEAEPTEAAPAIHLAAQKSSEGRDADAPKPPPEPSGARLAVPGNRPGRIQKAT
jgi:hypothetical protein